MALLIAAQQFSFLQPQHVFNINMVEEIREAFDRSRRHSELRLRANAGPMGNLQPETREGIRGPISQGYDVVALGDAFVAVLADSGPDSATGQR